MSQYVEYLQLSSLTASKITDEQIARKRELELELTVDAIDKIKPHIATLESALRSCGKGEYDPSIYRQELDLLPLRLPGTAIETIASLDDLIIKCSNNMNRANAVKRRITVLLSTYEKGMESLKALWVEYSPTKDLPEWRVSASFKTIIRDIEVEFAELETIDKEADIVLADLKHTSNKLHDLVLLQTKIS